MRCVCFSPPLNLCVLLVRNDDEAGRNFSLVVPEVVIANQ